jgi:hypothetical protein
MRGTTGVGLMRRRSVSVGGRAAQAGGDREMGGMGCLGRQRRKARRVVHRRAMMVDGLDGIRLGDRRILRDGVCWVRRRMVKRGRG